MSRNLLFFLFAMLVALCSCKTLLKKSAVHIEKGPKMPVGVYQMGYATDGKIIFSVGGSTFLGAIQQPVGEIYLFSPYGEEWLKGRLNPKPLIKGPTSSTYVPERKLILSTGFAEKMKGNQFAFPIELLDLETYHVEYIRSNPHYALESTIVSHAGKVYMFGGIAYSVDGASAFSDRMLAYDLDTDTWEDLAPMPAPRVTRGLVVGENLYTFGGYDGAHTYADIWKYDFENDSWETAGYLPYPVRDFGLALQYPYVFLATVGKENNMIGMIDLRDGSYAEFKTWLTMTSPGVAIVGNELFIFGGSFDQGRTASNRSYRIPLSELTTSKK